MPAKKKYPALGRGLDALISTDIIEVEGSSSVGEVELSLIHANPNQPRREFDEQALDELAESIRQIGIIQPITVRKMDDGTYQIIAGERRWRASQRAGLNTIPAYIRTADDERVMQMALVENIQREDLNAIEVAMAYQNIIDQQHLTQDALAEKVGKSRAAVANSLRLLKLPAQVQLALQDHKIDPGHARAILAVPQPSEQVRLFNEIILHGYSVRQVEEMAKDLKEGRDVKSGSRTIKSKSGSQLPAEYEPLRRQLCDYFATEVQMTCKNGKGRISIPFADEEELGRILSIFDKFH